MDSVTISSNAMMGYGGNRKSEWRTALISPEGEIVFMETLGYHSTVRAEAYSHHFIRKFYSENPEHNFSELMVKYTSQVLSLGELRRMTNLELVWGSPDAPITSYSCSPNGQDLEWFLVWAANGVRQVQVQGKLPEGWFEMEDWEQDEILDKLS